MIVRLHRVRVHDRTAGEAGPGRPPNDQTCCALCFGAMPGRSDVPVCTRPTCLAEHERLSAMQQIEMKNRLCAGCGGVMIMNGAHGKFCARYVECDQHLTHEQHPGERTPTGRVARCEVCGEMNITRLNKVIERVCTVYAECRREADRRRRLRQIKRRNASSE